MSKRYNPKKSYKQKLKEKELNQLEQIKKFKEQEKDLIHVFNKIKNAVYIVIILVIIGSLFSSIMGLIIYIAIGMVVAFLIYLPVGKELEKRKKALNNGRTR